MNRSVARHRVLIDWEDFIRGKEEAFREPIIVSHLEKMGEIPGVFDSVFGNLVRDLAAQPWLVEDGGYDWVTERGAYRFAAEALNQSRVLNALGGLVDASSPKQRRAAAGIAARQSLHWRLDNAEPYCQAYREWKFVVLPFGWDNLASLMLLALRAHGQASPVYRRLFGSAPDLPDWRRPAKGLLLAALPLSEPTVALVDSFSIGEMRAAHPWLEDAIFSLAQIDDPIVRTLASICTDWVIGHEVCHALLHETVPWSIEREMQADRAGLLQLIAWTRPRDLTGIDSNLSPNFYDYLSAVLGLMTLSISSMLRMPGEVDGGLLGRPDLAELRSASLRRVMLDWAEATTVTPEEIRLMHALDETFADFLSDLKRMRSDMPNWAGARARFAARDADTTVRDELAAHKAKGGGPILPQ